jgi:hypothetical protein
MITHIHACLCGAETPCEPDQLSLGRVFQCPACKVVWAHVRPHRGGRAWIRVAPDDVEFHDLLDEPEPEN